MNDLAESLLGVILGTAVGDSLGLPAEGVSRQEIEKWHWDTPLKHRFLFGRGMVSDDTEHTFFVAQSLLVHDDDPQQFIRSFAWKLRWWFAAIPAGVGLGTARALVKLWLGFPPSKSGVFTAGNGPAMRSALLGVYFYDNPELMRQFVECSTRVTHTDPKALYGAMAIAHCAALGVRGTKPDTEELFEQLKAIPLENDTAWNDVVDLIARAVELNLSVKGFADLLGQSHGISGYTYHTVPITIYAWLKEFGDFEATVQAVISCGGDSDTTGAIVGALAGAAVGGRTIPSNWIDGICEWPRTVVHLREIARRLAVQKAGESAQSIHYFVPGVLVRNLFFLTVVLFHGLVLRPVKKIGSLFGKKSQ